METVSGDMTSREAKNRRNKDSFGIANVWRRRLFLLLSFYDCKRVFKRLDYALPDSFFQLNYVREAEEKVRETFRMSHWLTLQALNVLLLRLASTKIEQRQLKYIQEQVPTPQSGSGLRKLENY